MDNMDGMMLVTLKELDQDGVVKVRKVVALSKDAVEDIVYHAVKLIRAYDRQHDPDCRYPELETEAVQFFMQELGDAMEARGLLDEDN